MTGVTATVVAKTVATVAIHSYSGGSGGSNAASSGLSKSKPPHHLLFLGTDFSTVAADFI